MCSLSPVPLYLGLGMSSTLYSHALDAHAMACAVRATEATVKVKARSRVREGLSMAPPTAPQGNASSIQSHLLLVASATNSASRFVFKQLASSVFKSAPPTLALGKASCL
ncbi:hypothetical protein JTE90_012089 [Oedothorax gibbosus]|uniref:Uncharacterized protein n=1 Tax=Oedothorax gibbosus TaxID=931172 RepID=A0AAV6UL13_9ARAC|nr:hypothetical protein JTE90_012089 [Oedothorax gibbosus]